MKAIKTASEKRMNVSDVSSELKKRHGLLTRDDPPYISYLDEKFNSWDTEDLKKKFKELTGTEFDAKAINDSDFRGGGGPYRGVHETG